MDTSAIANELAGQDFFEGLDPAYLTFLADHAALHRFARNDILFRHGDRADRFYLLQDGLIGTEVAAIAGPALELSRLGPGEMAGWSWLIPPYRWHFQARALEDSDVLVFDGGATLAHCEAEPRFGYELFKRFSGMMSQRLSEAREKMMDEWQPPGFA
jgi:CRP-like cAMP-binding protein